MTNLLEALKLGVAGAFSFFVVCVSWRYLANGAIVPTYISDALYLALSYSIFKQIQEAQTLLDRLAYIFIAPLGSTAAILLTKVLH